MNDVSKVEMFVITHKDLFLKIPKNYKVIGVGDYGMKNKANILSDSSGENISSKNPYYCELTAIYWLWKNYDLPNYIGICHYRRFFVEGIFCKIYNTDQLLKLLQNYDVILPNKSIAKPNVWQYFCNSISGREKDLLSLEKLIAEQYPDYLNTFQKVMHSQSASYCNMMVMKKEDFCNYCEWLFGLLEKFEDYVDLTGYSKQEQRIYGFMSEFLLNVWVYNNKKSAYFANSILFTENKVVNRLKKIKTIFKRVVSNDNRK